jgi:hypothetical protein
MIVKEWALVHTERISSSSSSSRFWTIKVSTRSRKKDGGFELERIIDRRKRAEHA